MLAHLELKKTESIDAISASTRETCCNLDCGWQLESCNCKMEDKVDDEVIRNIANLFVESLFTKMLQRNTC